MVKLFTTKAVAREKRAVASQRSFIARESAAVQDLLDFPTGVCAQQCEAFYRHRCLSSPQEDEPPMRPVPAAKEISK